MKAMQRDFLFLDGLEDNQREPAVRRHLMKERRRGRIARLGQAPTARLPLPWGRNVAASESQLPSGISEPRLQSKESESDSSSVVIPFAQNKTLTGNSSHIRRRNLALSTQVERDLISIDPFTTFPIKLNQYELELVHFSKRLFIELSPKWTSSVFSEKIGLMLSLTYEAMFCNLLSVTSAYLDSVSGRGARPETFKWSLIGLRRINNLLADPATQSGDELLMTLPQILISDSMTTGGENTRLHSRGLAQLVKHRGGLESPGRTDSIDSWICILLVVSSKAQTSYLDDKQDSSRIAAEVRDWKVESDFLFSAIEDLTSWISEKYPHHSKMRRGVEEQYLIFGTQLSQPEDQYEEAYQIFLLGYLALSLWEHRNSVQDTSDLLWNFSFEVQQIQSAYPLPDISYILIRGLDNNRARKWRVARMVKVLFRVPEVQRFQIKYFLFQIIQLISGAMQVPLPGIEKLTNF